MCNFLKVAFVTVSFLVTTFFTTNPAALAKEPAAPQLSLAQSMELALYHNNALKTAKYEIEQKYEVRKDAEDDVEFTPTRPTTTDAERAFYALVQADLSWEMSKKTYSAGEDTVIMNTYKAYYNILQMLEKVSASELAVKSADLQKKAATAGYFAGTVSKVGLIQAEAALKSAESNLEANRLSLNDMYQKFNRLIGLFPEDRPVLVDRPVFAPLKIDNPEPEIERAIALSPSNWQARKMINFYDLQLDLYNFTTSSEPYKVKELDVEKAKVSASDADEQMRQLMRTIFYTIHRIEEQYAGLQENIRISEEDLRVVKVKYDIGLATKAEVAVAESSLAQTKQSLLDLVCQHDILLFAFKKPWAYAG